MLSFNAAYEPFVPPYARLSHAVMRMTRIALYELLVSFGSDLPTRSGGYPALRRVSGTLPQYNV